MKPFLLLTLAVCLMCVHAVDAKKINLEPHFHFYVDSNRYEAPIRLLYEANTFQLFLTNNQATKNTKVAESKDLVSWKISESSSSTIPSDTLFHIENQDTRRSISMGWIDPYSEVNHPFQIASFPCEISHLRRDDSVRTYLYPVEEIEQLYVKEEKWDKSKLYREHIYKSEYALAFDLEIESRPGSLGDFNINFYSHRISYNALQHTLTFDDEFILLPRKEKDNIHLRVLIDNTCTEIFYNKGERVYKYLCTPDENYAQIVLTTDSKAARFSTINVRHLKSFQTQP